LTKTWPDLFRQITRPPETVAEAVDWLMDILDDEGKTNLAAMREEELINLHFSLGLAIRNSFRLHELDCKLASPWSFVHPDDVSAMIIHELWKKLTQD
jgi:hypothetical protein